MSVTIFTILQYAPSLALPPGLFSQVLHFEMGTNMQFFRIYTPFSASCIFLSFPCCTYIFCQKAMLVHGIIFRDHFFHNDAYVSCYYVFHFIHMILTSHLFIPTWFPMLVGNFCIKVLKSFHFVNSPAQGSCFYKLKIMQILFTKGMTFSWVFSTVPIT